MRRRSLPVNPDTTSWLDTRGCALVRCLFGSTCGVAEPVPKALGEDARTEAPAPELQGGPASLWFWTATFCLVSAAEPSLCCEAFAAVDVVAEKDESCENRSLFEISLVFSCSTSDEMNSDCWLVMSLAFLWDRVALYGPDGTEVGARHAVENEE